MRSRRPVDGSGQIQPLATIELTVDSSEDVAEPRAKVRNVFWLLVSLAAVSASLTLLFLGMRSVMAIGGTCAQGGPFEIASPCPKGIPLVMVGSIWGGLIFAGVYIWQSTQAKVPSLAGFLWPALFLTLGWNFFEFAFRASNEGQGLAWGWIVCGVLFALIGGIPLWIATQTLFGRRSSRLGSIANIGGSIQMAASGLSAFRQLRNVHARHVKIVRDGMAAWPQAPGTTMSSGTTMPSDTTTSPFVGTPENLVTVLAKLDELHRSGALSDQEYQAAKTAVLGKRP